MIPVEEETVNLIARPLRSDILLQKAIRERLTSTLLEICKKVRQNIEGYIGLLRGPESGQGDDEI